MKSSDKNNRMTHVKINKACNGAGRSEQRVESQYCDVATRYVVTKLEGPKEVKWRGVPVGWSE